eukprot:Polyplicarium_translucidae@DN4233_c0_g1_i1.p1
MNHSMVVRFATLSLLLVVASAFGGSKKEPTHPPPHPNFHFTVSEKLCRISPSNFENSDSRFFIVECDPTVKSVKLQFTDAPNTDRKQTIYDSSFNVVDSVEVNPQDGIYTNTFQSCDNYNDAKSCDAYRVEVRGGSAAEPFIEWVTFSRTPPEFQGTFDPMYSA